MADAVNQIFIPASADEIRDQFLRDVRLEADAVGVANPPVGKGSDWYILGTALANVALIQFANARIADDDSDVLTAGPEALEELRIAYGLPEVKATGSSGKIVVTVLGAIFTTIPGGTQLVLPNGKRAQVVGTHINLLGEPEVDIAAIDTGEDTNFPAGAVVRFVSAPVNVEAEAVVSVTSPLVGGTDAETPDRKRDRILNRLRNVPGGGNWGHIRQIVLDNVGSLDGAFIYPAAGGPGSVKVVVTKPIDVARNNYLRSATADQLQRARAAIQSELPGPMEVAVGTVSDTLASVSLQVTIPDAVGAGGNGKGWIDTSPWPDLDTGSGEEEVTISAVTSSTQITVTAATATTPVAGVTHIAWWSLADQRFRTFLVTAVAGSSGAWQLTLDKPLVDSTGATAQIGDYISPAMVNATAYGKTWVGVVSKFGPGELTSDANRLPRAKRHPVVTDPGASPMTMTVRQLKELLDTHDEITDIAYSTSTLPAVLPPATVDDEPACLVPGHFGMYAKA